MSNPDPDSNQQSIESRILVTMRQVLASVIREVTPQPGMRHPLSKETIEDVRQCFSLISARERELRDIAAKTRQKRPRYIDETSASQTVHFEKKLK